MSEFMEKAEEFMALVKRHFSHTQQDYPFTMGYRFLERTLRVKYPKSMIEYLVKKGKIKVILKDNVAVGIQPIMTEEEQDELMKISTTEVSKARVVRCLENLAKRNEVGTYGNVKKEFILLYGMTDESDETFNRRIRYMAETGEIMRTGEGEYTVKDGLTRQGELNKWLI